MIAAALAALLLTAVAQTWDRLRAPDEDEHPDTTQDRRNW